MTERVEDGGPAYPLAWKDTNEYGVSFTYRETGMSLRDHFAGQAMVPILASAGHLFEHRRGKELRNAVAETAYAIADAMLAARARQMGLDVGGANG